MTALNRDRYWRAGLALLLLLRLVLGLAYSALNPLGEAPDEADHYAYVVYIGQEGRLPEGTTVTQGKHPPLYYLLAAAAGRAAGLDFDFLRANPDVGVTADALAPNFFIHTAFEAWPWQGGPLAMHLARAVSVLAGLLLVLATYGLGRGLWPARPEIALAGAAFVAFLPESLFVGGAVTNDMLAAALAAVALWWALAGQGWPAALGTGVALGLGFLTKASVIAIWPVAALALLLGDGWHIRRPFRHLERFILTAVIATAIAVPWLWRNWTLYGDPLGTPVVLGTIDRRTAPLDLLWLARGWFLSFWGKFGGAGHIALPWPLYALWGVIAAGAVAGAAKVAGYRLKVAREGERPSTSGSEPMRLSRLPAQDAFHTGAQSTPAEASTPNLAAVRWLVLAGAPLLVMLSMVSYSQLALGTDQGRLLFPTLAPIGLLIAAGLAAWLPTGRSRWLAPALAGVMLLAALLALQLGIRQPFAPRLATAAEVASAAPVQAAAGPLELVAAAWSPDTGAEPSLMLYWRAAQPAAADLRVILRMYGSDGAVLWEWKRSPGAGRYSTDRWQPAQVIRDAYRIPAEALAVLSRADVTVYAFPDETPLGRADVPLPGDLGPAE